MCSFLKMKVCCRNQWNQVEIYVKILFASINMYPEKSTNSKLYQIKEKGRFGFINTRVGNIRLALRGHPEIGKGCVPCHGRQK